MPDYCLIAEIILYSEAGAEAFEVSDCRTPFWRLDTSIVLRATHATHFDAARASEGPPH